MGYVRTTDSLWITQLLQVHSSPAILALVAIHFRNNRLSDTPWTLLGPNHQNHPRLNCLTYAAICNDWFGDRKSTGRSGTVSHAYNGQVVHLSELLVDIPALLETSWALIEWALIEDTRALIESQPKILNSQVHRARCHAYGYRFDISLVVSNLYQ